MKIKKIGHCCLVIETSGKKIMTDPGSYTILEQTKEFGIDLILITHEHGDHFHVESLKKIIKNNPSVKIITNAGVGRLLDESDIKYEVLGNKIIKNILGIEFEAHDCKHEEIFREYVEVQNTAYFIDGKLFYPGDSFYNPGKHVEILALPVAGPWTRIKDAVKYALLINPKICFPVHDGMLNNYGTSHRVPELFLAEVGIVFKNFEKMKQEEF